MGATTITGPQNSQPKLYLTLHGLPLLIELQWPFFRSKTGADFHILHGTVRLATDPALHALFALQLTMTLREVLPSLEPQDVEWPALNTVRKAVDNKAVELMKSPKRIPIQFGSRTWDFKRGQWIFGQASEPQLERFLQNKLYWHAKLHGANAKVWLADPVDAQYLQTPAEKFMEIARGLAGRGVLRLLEREYAQATDALISQAAQMEADAQHALEELEQKHAFERG